METSRKNKKKHKKNVNDQPWVSLKLSTYLKLKANCGGFRFEIFYQCKADIQIVCFLKMDPNELLYNLIRNLNLKLKGFQP